MSDPAENLPSRHMVYSGIENLSFAQLQYIAEQATDYWLVLDEADRVVHCSQLEDGLLWTEIANQSPQSFVDHQYHDLLREKYAEVRRTGEFSSCEVVADLRGQGFCNLRVRVGPFYDAETPGGLILFFRDHTQQTASELVLKDSEFRYRTLFQLSPIPLWEEDFSELKKYFDELRANGVVDLKSYLDEHPEEIAACAMRVRVMDVNQATLRLLKADSMEQLLATLDTVLGPEAHDTFRRQLIDLAGGTYDIRSGSVNYALDGSIVPVDVHFTVVPEQRETWSRVIVSTVDISRQKNAEAQVQQYQKNLRQLSAELSAAENRERRRIATLLHDDVGQVLALTRLKLGQIARKAEQVDETCFQQTQDMDRMLRDVIKSVRSLTSEVGSPILYEFGFEAAIRKFAEQMEDGYGVNVDLALDGAHAQLNETAVGLLYRFSRELMLNVVKHAKANRLVITSTLNTNKGYELSFKDDGIGFDPAEVSKISGLSAGFGLFSIQAQIGHIDGAMEILAEPGKGAEIILRVPVSAGDPA